MQVLTEMDISNDQQADNSFPSVWTAGYSSNGLWRAG